MKELKKLHLKSANVLSEKEMKQVFGGSGSLTPVDVVRNTCRVGDSCSVTYVNEYLEGEDFKTGHCQGRFSNGKVECYCDAHGPGSGSMNSTGVSKCYK